MGNSVGCITYHRSINYGSVLQAYALNQFLRAEGYDATLIDYSNAGQKKIYQRFEPVSSILSVARNLHTLAISGRLQEKDRRFTSFLQQVKKTDSQFHMPQELELISDIYDFYVCGSDQIWNPQCSDFDCSYLLDFVANKEKCVSYAPSIAVRDLPPEWNGVFREALKDYRALSVRERQGCQIISNLVKRPVSWVCDPVFLLPALFWGKEAKQGKVGWEDKPYIFCYFIGDVPGMRDFSVKAARVLRSQRVLVNKNLRDIGKPGKRMYEAGPYEFLSLILGAKCVCANSFHAVAFSLIFQKNFWVFDDSHNPRAASSRIRDILSLIGLENRILSVDSVARADPAEPIDYSKVRMDLLQTHIENSKRYLREALRDKNGV